jgi:hypothetical protein
MGIEFPFPDAAEQQPLHYTFGYCRGHAESPLRGAFNRSSSGGQNRESDEQYASVDEPVW